MARDLRSREGWGVPDGPFGGHLDDEGFVKGYVDDAKDDADGGKGGKGGGGACGGGDVDEAEGGGGEFICC